MRLFTRKRKKKDTGQTDVGWEDVPAFIPADPADLEKVALISTAIALGDRPSGQYLVKKVEERNPEAREVAIIAGALAAGLRPNSKFTVKRIMKRTDEVRNEERHA